MEICTKRRKEIEWRIDRGSYYTVEKEKKKKDTGKNGSYSSEERAVNRIAIEVKRDLLAEAVDSLHKSDYLILHFFRMSQVV